MICRVTGNSASGCASMKGWKWAEENPEDAAMIVLDYDETGAQTAKDTYVLQWQTGFRLLILPEELRDAPAVFPFR